MATAASFLVTGITGNVGEAVAEHLLRRGAPVRGGVKNVERAQTKWKDRVKLVRLDFLEPSSFAGALEGVSGIFLMRPPALGESKTLLPFIQKAKESGVRHIVFISLPGVERNPLQPHYRIEKYVKNSGIPYTFFRPSFFMQNLNTTHRDDIRSRSDLFIPAGKAPVSMVDVRDIGEAAAIALTDPERYANLAFTLTGPGALSFEEAASLFSRELGRSVTYSDPSAGEFKREMLRRGLPKEFVNAMVALFFTVKLGLAKKTTSELETILGRKPTTLEQYIRDYRDCWM